MKQKRVAEIVWWLGIRPEGLMKHRQPMAHPMPYQGLAQCALNRTLLAFMLLFVLASDALAQRTATAAGHCAADEVTYFSCPLAGLDKIASLCGTVSESPIVPVPEEKLRVAGELASLTFLEYRYGSLDRIELRFGARAHEFHRRFSVRSVRSLTERVDTVWFINDVITHGLEVREGENLFTGLWVRYPTRFREFACQGSPGDLSAFRRLTR